MSTPTDDDSLHVADPSRDGKGWRGFCLSRTGMIAGMGSILILASAGVYYVRDSGVTTITPDETAEATRNCRLGFALVLQGEHAEGIALLRRALSIDPMATRESLLDGVRTLLAEDRVDAAIMFLYYVLILDPKNIQVRMELA